MIRKAIYADVETLAAMGHRFIEYSAHGGLVSPAEDDLRDSIRRVIDCGVVFVAEIQGEIVGFIYAAMSTVWFSPMSKVAIELAWWIDESHRGGTSAIRLVHAYESWAKEQGASVITMSDLIINGSPSAGTILARMGYVMSERSHVKGAY